MLVVWRELLLTWSAGVTPQKFIDYLFGSSFWFVIYFQRLFNLVQLIYRFERMSYSTMCTKDGVLENGSDG